MKPVFILVSDRELRGDVHSIFAIEGFSPRTGASVEDAARLLEYAGVPCALIMDAELIGSTEWKELSRRNELASIPVIAVSRAPDVVRLLETVRRAVNGDSESADGP